MNSDLSVLHFFNQTIASETLDPIMIALTSVKVWFPVYLIGGALLIWKYKWQGVRVVLFTVALVLLGDQLSAHVLRPWIDRLRPCATLPSGAHVVEWIRLPDGPRLGPSFPSSHAVNNFAVATFFATFFNESKWAKWLFIPALLIAITRLYLGLHYPSDVVGGMLLGMLLGVMLSPLARWTEERIHKLDFSEKEDPPEARPAPTGPSESLPWKVRKKVAEEKSPIAKD